MDWSRFTHLSLSDFRGIVSRRTVILMLMAVFIYQGVGIFYRILTLQIFLMKPSPAVEAKAPAAAAAPACVVPPLSCGHVPSVPAPLDCWPAVAASG